MDRRSFVFAGLAAPVLASAQAPRAPLKRVIPKSGEAIPAVGLGTWLTFDVALDDSAALTQRAQVLDRFFAAGGGVIDSSPMYGNAEALLGRLLPDLPHAGKLFAATKVWTPLTGFGPTQMRNSLRLWRLERCDLMQVHNLLNWRAHLKTLRAWKDEGRARYIGVTTSHGRDHGELADIVKREPIDFMQITYSPADTTGEPLLALAAERGVAVIVNRPFDGGALLDRVAHRALPGFATELDAASWAALVLKWELAHPAVTCAIPATTRPDHLLQNMAALHGPLPDARLRRRIVEALR